MERKGIENDILYLISGEENETFTVTFTYVPKEESDPNLIQVADLTVTGGGAQALPTRIRQGTIFYKNTEYLQSFERTDIKKAITIQLDFESRPGVEILVAALRPQDIIPVGTMIQSILPWDKYVEAVNDEAKCQPDANKPNTSLWAPCDGRDITGSGLAGLWAGHTNAPDLRGVFLRGLNQFVPDDELTGLVDAVSGEQKDLGSKREAGVLAQPDTVGGHRHEFAANKKPAPPPQPSTEPPRRPSYLPEGFDHRMRSVAITPPDSGFLPRSITRSTPPVGADIVHLFETPRYPHDRNYPTGDYNPGGETRPRNIAVYYYIKIN
uniref:Phage Tail Collar Domain n=1 Tax=Candidatus Kentrum sp. FM TaxID=2126340 RepID=A0A450SS34_9GAMM|nr:MAG: hypothetical protein BECKFM1743A_GA0114220_101752 [Candidatus Kentron sp. FM]VFJ56890.1 MAG: hypothetical protein BECKFM1743C_GA0114222_101876 [Candidatus Kentron sp. FM]VFK11502.1 MAG: hypothetical protein BECKFM1743B_GA0114221_101866 [Candidatus Kentron sp. FM]